MRNIVLVLFILTLLSCSDLNKVKIEGTRVLNGKTVRTLYVDTDIDVKKIKSQLIHRYGNPNGVSSDGGLVWNISNMPPILGGFTITKTIYFDSIFHFDREEKIFDFMRVSECITDQEGNDLLIESKMQESGKKYFQETINDIEME